jgi:hypothetical protein
MSHLKMGWRKLFSRHVTLQPHEGKKQQRGQDGGHNHDPTAEAAARIGGGSRRR